MMRSRDHFGFWQGLLRVVGSFGDCPRCLAVCPVGNDYHAHLAERKRSSRRRRRRKALLAKERQDARKRGDADRGPLRMEIRWVGPDGYKGIVARQLQDFKRRQKERRRPRTPAKEPEMVAVFQRALTAAEIKAKAQRARRRSRWHRRRRA